MVYFVAETKGSDDLRDNHLSDGEQGKITSARRHFDEIGASYLAPVSSLESVITKLEN